MLIYINCVVDIIIFKVDFYMIGYQDDKYYFIIYNVFFFEKKLINY